MRKKGFIVLLLIALVYWGYFFSGKIRNLPEQEKTGSDVMEIPREAGLKIIEGQVKIFEVIEGRYPDTLEELIEKEYMGVLPDAYGRPWEYDSSDGRVN
ncbi:MAG: hypothetical protein GX817_02440 [Elusimicrobia bacterium]|nr:hypothetical protein [Elusimicrobiota bacterium]